MGKNFKKAQFETSVVNKLEQIIKMLQLGHLDAIVASVPEVYAAFRRLGIKPFPHDVSHPIAVHQDRLLCRGVKIAFIDKFNKLLKQLRNRGRLKNILGDNYIAE